MNSDVLSKFLIERRERAGSEKLPVWSVSNQLGLVLPEDIFNKTIASEDTRNYKVVRPDDFAYNPSRINIGSIALNTSKASGLVSPMYVVFSIKDTQILDPKYLFFFLKSPAGSTLIQQNTQGGVRFRLKFSDLIRLRIPLHDLKEQKRLVKNIEKALALKNKRFEADQKIDQLVSAVFNNFFGNPLADNSKWERRSLGDLLVGIDGGWSPVCLDRPAKPDEWGVLKLGAVSSHKYVENENKAITENTSPRSQIEVHKGDLLFSRKNTRDLVGASAFVFESRPRLMLSDLIFRFKFKSDANINPIYLWGLLTEPTKRKQVQALATGSASTMLNISKARLLNLPVEIPPINIQNQFAQTVEAIELHKKKQSKSHEQIDELFSAILSKAYDISKKDIVDQSLIPSPIKVFPIQQAVGVILQQGFERGEMVLGKVLYIGQEIYKVGLGVSFVAYKFGPWDIVVKNAVNGGASKKNQFFKRKKIGKGAVFTVGPNVNKLFEPYANSAVTKDMNTAMKKLLPLIKFWKSSDIECLATVCKVIQDNKTLDERVVAQKVSEWKPNKFTADRVQYMLDFITKQKWDEKLLS